MLTALELTAGHPRVAVDYDRLMANPADQLRRIAKQFGLPFDPSSPALSEYRSEFLQVRLRHSLCTTDELQHDQDCPPNVVALHEVLQTLSNPGEAHESANTATTLAGLAHAFRNDYVALRYMRHCEDTIVRQARQLSETGQRIDGMLNVSFDMAALTGHSRKAVLTQLLGHAWTAELSQTDPNLVSTLAKFTAMRRLAAVHMLPTESLGLIRASHLDEPGIADLDSWVQTPCTLRGWILPIADHAAVSIIAARADGVIQILPVRFLRADVAQAYGIDVDSDLAHCGFEAQVLLSDSTRIDVNIDGVRVPWAQIELR